MLRDAYLRATPCLFLLLHLLLFQRVRCQSAPSLQFEKVLDPAGLYLLRWGHNDTHAVFEVTVRTLGYVGFGLSGEGRMFPADMVIGWVQGANVFFADYYTTKDRSPKMDPQQNWKLLYGFETDGNTTIAFMRKLDTCDVNDVAITPGTMQLIYSYHSNDPDVDTGLVPYHGRTMRGTRYINFLSASLPMNGPLPPDTYRINITNQQYPVPTSEIAKICISFMMKDVFPESHLIKYEALISPGNAQYVLRIVLNRCRAPVDLDPGLSGRVIDCQQQDVPAVVRSCKTVLVTWSFGGEPVSFGEQYGIPLGGATDPDMYVLEIHYSNPDKVQGIVDSSGLSLTYTTTLRSYHAAFLELGYVITPGWRSLIPPGESQFPTHAHCSRRCIQWGLTSENDPVYAVGVIFHGNDIVTSMRLRHFRHHSFGGVSEMPWLANDKAFSVNYQPIRMFKTPVEIILGDSLALECTYDSAERKKVIRGGWSRREAMCRASLLYYPRKAMDKCLSWSSLDRLKSARGVTVPETLAMRYLNRVRDWSTNSIMKRHLRLALTESSERALCTAPDRRPSYAIDRFRKPEVGANEYRAPETSCQPAQAVGVSGTSRQNSALTNPIANSIDQTG